MKLLKRGSRKAAETEGIIGKARHDPDNREPAKKVRSGEIAVIDHVDLDQEHAEALIHAGAGAVINTSTSISGRYATTGPQLLARAGVVLVDQVDKEPGSVIRNGDTLRVHDGVVYKGNDVVGRGVELDEGRITQLRETAALDLSTKMEAVVANAADHLRHQSELVIEGVGAPRLRQQLRRRPMVVVDRGVDVESDLHGLRDYIKHYEPVLIGAGAGADYLLANGYDPDVVVGDIESMSDRALRSGADVVVTVTPGQQPVMERAEKAGAHPHMFKGVGSDADLTLLLADANDAALIVLAGGTSGMMEMLDEGPADSASTLVTRLRMSDKFVDAKAVGEFYRHRSSVWPIMVLIAVSLLAVVTAVAVTPNGSAWVSDLGTHARDLVSWAKGWFS